MPVIDKPPKLELNVVAKPKGNWVVPTTIAEIRAALLNGTCVETLYDGDWVTCNPYSTYTQGRLHLWMEGNLIRFNMDKKVVYMRTALLLDAGNTFLQQYALTKYQHLLDVEESELFKDWLNSRSFVVVGKDTYV